MRRTLKVPGHKFLVTARHEPHNHRSAATYEAACSCGCWAFIWPDRLSVVRTAYRKHLKQVSTTSKETTA